MAEERIRELEAQVNEQAGHLANAQAQTEQLQAQINLYAAVPTAENLAQAMAQAMAHLQPPARAEGGERQHRKVGGSMPTYSGKEDESYAKFESLFKGWADYNGLSDVDKKMQLFQALKGAAGDIITIFGPESEVYRDNDFQPYSEAIKALFETRAQSEAAKTAFEMCRQEKDELIQQYAARKLAKFRLAYPAETWPTNQYLSRLFVKDLRSDKVREQVVLKGAGAGANYHEIVRTASDVEASFEMLESFKGGKTGRPNGASVQVTQTAAKEEPMELGSMIAAMQTLWKANPAADPEAVLAAFRPARDAQGRYTGQRGRGRGANKEGCWNCGDNGHFARDCTKHFGGQGGQGGRGRGKGRGGNGRGRGANRGRGGFNSMENEQQQQQQQQPQKQAPQSAQQEQQAGGAQAQTGQGF